MNSREHRFEAFGRRITDMRTQMALTQKHVARSLGISRASLSHYENGRREPDLSLVKVFAEYYNVSTDYLLGNTDMPESGSAGRKRIPISDANLEMTPARELFLHWIEQAFGIAFWEDFVRMPDSNKYTFFSRCWQIWIEEKANSMR